MVKDLKLVKKLESVVDGAGIADTTTGRYRIDLIAETGRTYGTPMFNFDQTDV